MSTPMSPGVYIKEFDFSINTPGFSLSTGAFSGAFTWGPVMTPTYITDTNSLVETFGLPRVGYNRKDWYSVEKFLQSSVGCWVVRVVGPNATNAVATKDNNANVLGKEVFVPNADYFERQFINDPDAPIDFIAKYPGSLGNGLEVHILDALSFGASPYAPLFDSAPSGTEVHVLILKDDEILEKYDFLNTVEGSRKIDGTKAYYVDVLNESSSYVYITNPTGACSVLLRGGSLGATFATYGSVIDPMTPSAPPTPLARSLFPATGNGVRLVFIDENNYSLQGPSIQAILDTAAGGLPGAGNPGPDGVSVLVYDGVYLRETHTGWFKDPLSPNYYMTRFNDVCAYADLINAIPDWSNAADTDFVLSGATRDLHPQNFPGFENVQLDGYMEMEDFETYNYGIIIQGAASNFVGNAIIELAEQRKFSVTYVSPQFASVTKGGSDSMTKVIADRSAMYTSSYGYMDSNWALAYDRFNKTSFWMPMNPITASLNAKVENEVQPWYVGYGFNYGRIPGIIRLSWEQKLGVRDELYKMQINPVTTFRGDGPVVFGSKTLQAKPSAFDRLNVRKVFNYIELAISRSMKYYIGELNTEQTRLRVLNTINPFMRDIRSRQGIYDFAVRCDETNNTPYVIDSNQLKVDLAVKPARLIDFIALNFIAVPTGVDFKEVLNADNLY